MILIKVKYLIICNLISSNIDRIPLTRCLFPFTDLPFLSILFHRHPEWTFCQSIGSAHRSCGIFPILSNRIPSCRWLVICESSVIDTEHLNGFVFFRPLLFFPFSLPPNPQTQLSHSNSNNKPYLIACSYNIYSVDCVPAQSKQSHQYSFYRFLQVY